MSRFDYFEHIDGPQGRIDASGRMIPGKGGGGGDAAYYTEMNNLYGAQARAADFMLDTSMPYIAPAMQRSGQMVNDAFNGALSHNLRSKAAADATNSIGTSNADSFRALASYGAVGDPSGGRAADMANRNAISAAATRVGAQNQANQFAEDQKWNRNASLFTQATGMGGGAMQGMSSAAGGFGQMGNAQNQANMANAQGYGQFGGALAGGITKAADGGLIRKSGLKFASGGSVNSWEQYKKDNPLAQRKKMKGPSAGEALGMVAMGAAPTLIGRGLKEAWNSDMGKEARGYVGDKVKEAGGAVKDMFTSSAAPEQSLISNTASEAAQATPLPGLESTISEAVLPEAPVADFVAPSIESGIPEGLTSTNGVSEWVGSLFAADGGHISKPGLRLALGGGVMMPRTQIAKPMPGAGSMDASSQMRVSQKPTLIAKPMTSQVAGAPQQGGVTAGGVAGAAQKGVNAASKLSDAADASEKATEATEAARIASETIDTVDQADKALDAASAASDAVDAASNAADAADGAAGGNPITAGIKGIADIASGRDAGEAVADAAASYAGAEGGAMIGQALIPIPGVGAAIGGVLGGLLGGSIFADGGDVQGRADYRPGGDVQGPGTETSDDIPAWLSDGEFVNNAESVKLPARETKRVVQEWQREGGSTRELLEEINEKGLQKRYGPSYGAKEERAENRGQKPGLDMLANGGCAKRGPKLAGGGYLGVALGAGTQEYNRQRQMALEQERHQQQQAMAQQRMEMDKAQAARQEEIYTEQKAERGQRKAAQGRAADYIDSANALAGFDSSHMTTAEKSAAANAYRTAGYSPEALRGKATNEIAGLDLAQGLQLKDILTKQEQTRRKAAMSESMASGDTAGAVANAGGDWTAQDAGLELIGSGVDKSTGRQVVRLSRNGKELPAIDKDALPDFLEALTDPTKYGEYGKAQREIARNADEAANRRQQLAISGGHLGLAQQRAGLDAEDRKAAQYSIRVANSLKEQWLTETDPVKKAAIGEKLRVLYNSDPLAKGRPVHTSIDTNSGSVIVTEGDSVTQIPIQRNTTGPSLLYGRQAQQAKQDAAPASSGGKDKHGLVIGGMYRDKDTGRLQKYAGNGVMEPVK